MSITAGPVTVPGCGRNVPPVPLPGPAALPLPLGQQVSTVLHEWEDYPDHQEPGP